MIYNIYKFFTILFSPFIDLYILIRLLRKKEDKYKIKERYGFSTIKRPNGKIFWIQCASVGETNSALLLIDKILKNSSEKITILITTGTRTSAEMLSRKIKNNKNIIHQYTPIDKYFVIKRFLKYWKPTLLITVESEIWPNMIILSHKICKKVIIVNAKISKKSYIRWNFFKSFRKKIFNSIDICYTQTLFDKYKLNNLGIKNTIFLGNLKFDIAMPKIDENYKKELLEMTKNRRVILCSCTHRGEEEKLLELYKLLKKDFNNLLFIIIIRHPNRTNEVVNILSNYNVSISSKKEEINKNTDFYLYNEIGNIGTFYSSFKFVLMCGSLCDKIGGHTPIESAKFGSCIITGPYIKNNKSLYLELLKNKSCIICQDNNKLIQNLYDNIKDLFYNENKLNSYINNSIKVCKKYSDTSDKISKNILLNLK